MYIHKIGIFGNFSCAVNFGKSIPVVLCLVGTVQKLTAILV